MTGIFFQEWSVADKAACVAERVLRRASLAFVEGSGPEPSVLMVNATKRLRDLADDLFQVAMANSKARARGLRRY